MPQTLRLPRFENALSELHRKLPGGARLLLVRYTKYELVALFLP